MRMSMKKIIGSLPILGALTIGAAFTASNDFAPAAASPVVGYAKTTVSGATVNAIKFATWETGEFIWSTDLRLAGDTTMSQVAVSINDAFARGCGAGTFDPVANETTYFCEETPGTVRTEDVVSVGIVVQ